MNQKIWGDSQEKARLEHLLYKALTETTSVQLIMSSYPKPLSMLYSWNIDCNKFLVTNSIVFYLPLCSATSTLWCNWIISILNSSFFSIYTFPSFNTKSPSICYSSPCNTITPAFFIFSTTLTTSLSLLLAFLFFLLSLLQVLLLLLLLNYKFIVF